MSKLTKSTRLSQSGKQAKKRFDRILWGHKKKKGTALLIAVIAIIASTGGLVACDWASVGIIGGSDGPTSIFITKRNENESLCQSLYNARCKYIGSASDVGNILGLLSPIDGAVPCGMQLQTTDEPFGIIRWFDGDLNNEEELKRQASIILALVENAGYVSYSTDKGETIFKSYSRDELDIRFAESYEEFETLYNLIYADKLSMTDDELVSYAILNSNKGGYSEGECMGEGHIILGTDNIKNGGKIIYALTTFGYYGFENDFFIKVSGTGVIPAKITFDENNIVTEFLLPEDGSYYVKSIKEIFPKQYHRTILNGDYDKQYSDCFEQEKSYATAYLEKICRAATVCEYRDIEHKLPDLSAEVSNKLLDTFHEYPYWLGTQEKIVDGVRYVYKKSMEGDSTVIFEKYLYDTGETIDKIVVSIENDDIIIADGKMLKSTAKEE